MGLLLLEETLMAYLSKFLGFIDLRCEQNAGNNENVSYIMIRILAKVLHETVFFHQI